MKTKKILFSLALIVALNARSQVVPTIDWHTSYSSQDTIENVTNDMDASNTVYSTGYVYSSATNIDLIVQARDSTGLLLWTTLYDNGGTDKGKAIKFKPGVGVLVTGVSAGSGKDFVTIKLNATTGATVWVTRMNNFGSFDDEPNDIAVDASGNSFVTGFASASGGGHSDMVTVKYNSSGTQQWKNTYAGTASNSNDAGNSIVLSSNGNTVYVTGNVNQTSGNCNIVTRAISASAGTANWTSTFNGSANGSDKAYSIILAGANVVVCGGAANTTTGLDHLTIKYNGSNGTAIWTKSYDYGNYTNIATDLVRDSTGNIITTGYVYNNSTYSYHTLKYDSLGTQLFTNIENTGLTSITVVPHVACDSIAHHLYVCGEALRSTRDIFAYQISPTGNTKWKEYVDGQNYDLDAATSLVVNGIGVVYLSALSRNTFARYDITTIKISQTPVYFPLDYGTNELHDTNYVFQENKGQLLHPSGASVSQSDVAFYNQGVSPSLYFKNTRLSYIVSDRDSIMDSIVRVDMDLVGANQLSKIYNYGKVDALKHYFTTSASGITDIGGYTRLFVPNVFQDVDLHYYSNTSGLKSFYVAKYLEAASIPRFNISGATSTTIDANGYLIANTSLGNVNFGKLTAYQVQYNFVSLTYTFVPVTANWVNVGGANYKFSLTGTSGNWPTVIYVSKPGATSATSSGPNGNLWWATFIGSQGDEQIVTNKVDAKDNFFIGGYTTAAHYPTTTGAFNSGPGNQSSVQYGVFSKFNSLGKLDYSTYYGNTGSSCSTAYTQILDLAIDSLYNTYLVGLTTSNNMVIKTKVGAINYTSNSSTTGNCQNAFIAKLNPQGNQLHFSSYYGGSTSEKFHCVRYKNGQIYIGGNSVSSSIPLVTPQPNTYQITSGGGMYVHLDTMGVIKHSTKMHEPVVAGDVDNNGNYYMLSWISPSAGSTMPIISPAGSFYTHAYNGNWDWGLQRMTPNDSLNWSTPIGGTGSDYPSAISIRDSVMALCGYGSSGTSFPFQVANGDSGDVNFAGGTGFDIQMMKFNLKKGQILWSAYHGTDRNEFGRGVALDRSYNMFVTGSVAGISSLSTKLVIASASYNQPGYLGTEGIVLGYSFDNKKKWATFYGSLVSTLSNNFFDDRPTSIVVNNSGKLFISGITNAKGNTMPLVKWNSVCYWDSLVADPYPNSISDGFIAMFQTTELFPVGIKENSNVKIANGLLLFPNPNNGIFNIRFTENTYETVSINVINIMGQKVFEKNNIKVEGNELVLNLGELTKGIYLINISDGKRTNTIKFVVN